MAKVFYLEGLEKLSNKLKKNIKMADVKRVVSTNGAELTNKMTRNANFVFNPIGMLLVKLLER